MSLAVLIECGPFQVCTWDAFVWLLSAAAASAAVVALLLFAQRLKRFFRRTTSPTPVAQQAQTEALQHLQSHDSLTALPNRALLGQKVGEALAAARSDGSFAVMVLNLDRFKLINDSLGRHAGDALLIEVGRRIRSAIRRKDTLARYGGDEFALVLNDIGRSEDAQHVAAKLTQCLAEPVTVGATEIYTQVSIGISLYPNDGKDTDELLSSADAAMRHAKKLGGHQVQFFTSSMQGSRREGLTLATELRRAVSLGQLELHYQPKVVLASGRVEAAEALVRWRHPERGLLRPDAFLPLAEETGLIVPMSEWAINEACRQASSWLREERLQIQVAVNLSSQQFRSHDLVDCVRRALRDASLPPQLLKLELTEGGLIHDPKRVAQTLSQLSGMGVNISIDDFGVGYSSLAYLTRFPISELKIDRSFIAGMAADPANATIVRAVISLAHALRLQVVAEGVETNEQRQFLAELRCDQYQGYLCSPPVPARDFANLVMTRRLSIPMRAELETVGTACQVS
jgi:diguanylate cyclase (GGDEF)-like protein